MLDISALTLIVKLVISLELCSIVKACVQTAGNRARPAERKESREGVGVKFGEGGGGGQEEN